MSQFDDLAAKAAQVNEQHGDKIEGVSDSAIQQGGDRLDQMTDGKFAGQVDQAQAAADQRVGDNSQ